MAITGKQRSRRIDRNYTAVVDPSIRWKRWLGIAGLLAGLAYGVWMLSPLGAKQMSTGTLSKSHHAWNETGCDNCHLDYTSIKPTGFVFDKKFAVQENNGKCNSCHPMSDHYPSSMQRDKLAVESCVQCHHEHLGFNHDLLDIADESCVRCHKDLSQYVRDQTKNFTSITSFDPSGGHPEFPTLDEKRNAKDPGTISFSHVQHMRLGQPRKPGDATARTFQSLGIRFEDQYKARQLNGFVQLTCGDCHQRDHEVSGFAAMTALEAYTPNYKPTGTKSNLKPIPFQSNDHVLYKPIEFSKHCQACHQLDVPHELDFKDIDELTSIVETEQLQRKIKSAERQNLKLDLQDEDNRRFEQSSSGKNLVELLKNKDPEAKKTLFRTYGCNKCHQYSDDNVASANFTDIVMASGIKSQWLKDATFNHGSHLNVNCQECHNMELESNKAPDDPNPPKGGHASQILIGGVETCQKCHVVDETERARRKKIENVNVATADCIDCHRYHHDPGTNMSPVANQQPQGVSE
ncbi:MAG: cytochrome c3 family protein [Planctomycetota bacterium]|jgi:cytochrome c551/c552